MWQPVMRAPGRIGQFRFLLQGIDCHTSWSKVTSDAGQPATIPARWSALDPLRFARRGMQEAETRRAEGILRVTASRRARRRSRDQLHRLIGRIGQAQQFQLLLANLPSMPNEQQFDVQPDGSQRPRTCPRSRHNGREEVQPAAGVPEVPLRPDVAGGGDLW